MARLPSASHGQGHRGHRAWGSWPPFPGRRPPFSAATMATLVATLLFLFSGGVQGEEAGVQGQSGDFHVLADRADAAYMHRLASATGADATLQWTARSDPCNDTWAGVNCDSDGRVISINVHGRGLGGWVPGNEDNSSSMASLRVLDLGGNDLSGPLPVLALPLLQYLNLHGNAFTTIPERFFSGMKQLQRVSIGNNTLLHPWGLPADLQLLDKLEVFEASRARINGTLAAFLSNATAAFDSLWNVSLAGNHLVGPVPETFASGTLRTLDLSSNGLSGPIGFISNLPAVLVLRLDHNNFEGPLPTLTNTVAQNKITGLVPPLLLGEMTMVSLAGNILQGPVPKFASTVQNDAIEAVAGGSFCRLVPGPCDPDVTSLLAIAAALQFPEVLARSWRRNDACAGWLGVHCEDDGGRRRVTGINLSRLGLNGTIDRGFGSLVSLRFVSLAGNNISGAIPPAIAQLPNLRLLDVSGNALAGTMPKFRPDVEVWAEGNPALNISSSSPTSRQHRLLVAVVAMFSVVVFHYRA